jgi:2-C-methyl-D-erythritol 4-phosphate cytidylyltransferase
MATVSAIIVAAGVGRRMGFDKILALLHGKPVLYWSIAAFQRTPEVDEIIVVTREDTMEQVQRIVKTERLDKVRQVVAGGAERHLSVWNGLQAVRSEGSEFVAIHDGARPLVTPRTIADCLALARKHGAACCAAPIPDTVKRSSYEQAVMESVDRQNLWAMQTPQIFSSGLILQAYASLMAHNELVTDEVSAIQKIGKRVQLLQNDEYNFKITFPRDLPLAEQVLDLRAAKEREDAELAEKERVAGLGTP